MTKSRDLGNLAQTVAVNLPTALGTAGQTLVVNSGADGLEFGAASGGGVTVYTGLSGTDGSPSGATYLLNASNPSAGDLAYVSSNTSLYQNNGNGWYRIAVINTTPTISSVADASSNTTPFTLTGGTNTVITVTASDADEGTDLTYSYSVTSGSLNGTTVTQGTGASENVFTIAPHASNATTFSLTFTVSDNINAATSVAAFTLEFQITDSHYTTLLMATDGSQGDNSTITYDTGSSTGNSLTVVGDPHAGTFSPYRYGGYSVYFDGSGDSLNTTATQVVPTTSFTVAAWVYFRDTTDGAVWGQGTSGNSGRTGVSISLGNWYAQIGSSVIGSSTSVSAGQWYYTELQWDGSTLEFFVNGSSLGSVSVSTSPQNSAFYVGDLGSAWSTTYFLNGYVADVRVVSGTPSGSSTVPTERLTTVSGTGYSTSLLTCHLPYIVDGSSNAHAITVNGDPETKPFGPYDYNEYSESTNGGSVYFDGSDYLTYSHGALGSGNWTIEGWTYITSLSSSGYIFDFRSNDSNAPAFAATPVDGWKFISGGAALITYSSVPKTNTWYHFAIVKNNGTTTMYINGSSGGTYTDTLTYVGNSAATIAKYHQSATAYLNGYISDLRVVEGTAVYSGEFTPPSGPLTTTGGTYPSTTNVNTSITASNTSLLLKGTDAHVIDKSQGNNLKLIGTAASTSALTSGSTPPYIGAAWANTSAVSFDGDSDYVKLPAGSLDLGSSDFTIEAWIYQNANSGSGNDSHTIYSDWVASNADKSVIFRVTDSTGQKIQFLYTTNGSTNNIYTSTATISNSTWTHVAVCKDSTSLRVYIDGIREVWASSPSFTLNPNSGTIEGPLIGGGYDVNNTFYTQFFDGYIQDLRVTKGLARYTAADESSNILSTPLKG